MSRPSHDSAPAGMTPRRVPLPLLVPVLVAALGLLASCGGHEGIAPSVDSITEADLRSDLFALSDDSMAGRLVGTSESHEAADWISDRFESLGLEPAGDGGTYDQRFDLLWFDLAGGDRLSVNGGSARAPGDGWTPSNAGIAGRASGEVVFAGYGIVEPRLDYDDYRGDDVTGKVVLVLAGEPGPDDAASPFDGVVTAEASRTWRKVLSAQKRGAAGVLFVTDVQNRSDPDDWRGANAMAWPPERRRIERFTLAAWMDRIQIPAAQISVELAERLVTGPNLSLQELAEASGQADTGLGVVDLPDARVDFTTSVRPNVTQARNVLAMVEGSDPELRDEVVIIGGHYDHNGWDEDIVYNGADDDGSGTVGVMAVAKAYAQAAEAGHLPRRSVLFAVWDAEERGLLGSWYYTLHPLFPLSATAADLDLDMIGRNEEVPEDGGGRFRGLSVQSSESNSNAINILGYSRTPDLAASVQTANMELADAGAIDRALTLRLRYDNNTSNLLRRADHWPFLQNGVPAVWFHTGLHPDYHTPNDVPERVEYEKMTRIVRLVYQASWDLANADGRPGIEGMKSRPAS